MKIGDKVRCINNKPLVGNSIAPYLIVGNEYTILDVVRDSGDNLHLDVGIVSKWNYISSYETKEHLINGDLIHWCHPSRFELI